SDGISLSIGITPLELWVGRIKVWRKQEWVVERFYIYLGQAGGLVYSTLNRIRLQSILESIEGSV
ncbi:MAG: hypothetical protein ACFFBM_14130, partial [Promethearchaeota archaeon]